jgi:hypothetical protein
MVSLKIGKMVVVMDMFINIYIYINLNITYEHIQHTQKHSYIYSDKTSLWESMFWKYVCSDSKPPLS